METRFNTTEHMRDSVLFEGPEKRQRLSKFWMLLVLASIIAAAGVVTDSTATVIGAMIVAPLMTPILGTMLSTVLGDRANLIRSLLIVLAGAATAAAIGYLVGMVVIAPITAATNSQVAGRVTPGLIDLLAALATGVVGSVALVRRDISDALPGVAIAISLVPPLSVVGLTLESGEIAQSLGALLLFLTNVVAIIGTGVVVMSIYGVNRIDQIAVAGQSRRHAMRRPLILIGAMFVVIGIPLAIISYNVTVQSVVQNKAYAVTDRWAASVQWEVSSVDYQSGQLVIRVEGPLPVPNTAALKRSLDSAGISAEDVIVHMVPSYSVDLGSVH